MKTKYLTPEDLKQEAEKLTKYSIMKTGAQYNGKWYIKKENKWFLGHKEVTNLTLINVLEIFQTETK